MCFKKLEVWSVCSCMYYCWNPIYRCNDQWDSSIICSSTPLFAINYYIHISYYYYSMLGNMWPKILRKRRKWIISAIKMPLVPSCCSTSLSLSLWLYIYTHTYYTYMCMYFSTQWMMILMIFHSSFARSNHYFLTPIQLIHVNRYFSFTLNTSKD